jgi:hypothetical protein
VSDTGTLVVSRWNRYGQDRLYAVTSGGTRIGWWDLRTDEAHPESPEHAPGLAVAVADWKARTWSTASQRTVELDPEQEAVESPAPSALHQTSSMLVGQLDELVLADARWQYFDHLVIGPGGVFTLAAERHHGSRVWVGSSLWLDGQRTGRAAMSRREAARVATLLGAACGFDVPVVGLVVSVDARSFTLTSQPRDVFVVERKHLASWLLDRGEIMPDEVLAHVHDVARRPSTWR